MILLCIAITPLWRWHDIKHGVETMSAITILPLGLGGLLGLYLSAGAVDTIIYIHGLLLAIFCIVGIFWVLSRDGNAGGPANPNATINYNDAVVRATSSR